MRLRVSNLKLPIEHTEDDIVLAAARAMHVDNNAIRNLQISHKSVDARNKGDIRYIYSIDADVAGGNRILKNSRIKNVSEALKTEYVCPHGTYNGRPVVIGAGPAGLFAAYLFVEAGLKPILVERGAPVEERQKDVEQFWKNGILKPDSNVQFGEGGAGTFSDGKLNTVVKDRKGRCSFALRTFVRFGAPINILYDAKPHVGTDILVNVVKNMREYICEHGADVMFHTCVTGFGISKGCISSVITHSENTDMEIACDRVVLAIGHSSRDTFKILSESGISIEAKPFAVGLRIEHPQAFIDMAQYGRLHENILPTAPYKLTAQTGNGRGVYSFCMCPGGYVVNASSEESGLAVNGMSYSDRAGTNANSALIVTVTPQDYPGEDPLAGVSFQRELERKAYEYGHGAIPIQTYGDFKKAVTKEAINVSVVDAFWDGFEPCNKGKYEFADVNLILPKALNESLVEGMTTFGRYIKGFDNPKAIFSGVESRTSSPIKIWRDESGMSPSLYGLYPCGEGAGYAGGITSAAMDGLYIAEQIIMS